MPEQLPLLGRHTTEALIKANRTAAEWARFDPSFTPAERERRAAHYLAEAAKLEEHHEQ